MFKLGNWIARNRTKIIILFIVITIFMGYEATKLEIVDNITTYVPQNNSQNIFLKKTLDKFKMNNLILVGLEYNDIFSSSSIKNISALTDGLMKIKGVTSVLSLTNAPWITNENGSMEISKISQNMPSTISESVILKDKVMSSPIFKGQFVSKNGKSTIILVGLPTSMNSLESMNLTKTIENFVQNNSKATKIFYSGLSPSDVYAQNMSRNNLDNLIPLAFIAIAIILALSFRNIIGFTLPLISVLISAIWILGTIHLLGMTMTLADVAMPVIIIALGNAYGIYIVNKYLEEASSDHSTRIANTLKDVGIAVLLSASTVIVAFMSLLTVNIDPIRYFGIFTAVGIFYALIVNIFLTPAISSFYSKHIIENRESKLETSLWSKIASNILKHKIMFMIFSIAIVGFISIFTYKISPDMSLNKLVGKNNSIGKSMSYFNEQFGGSDFVIVTLKGNALDPYLLRTENLISSYADHNFKIVGSSYSLGKIIQNLNDKFNGENYIPASENKIQNLWFLMKGSDLSQIVNSGATETIIQFRVNVDSSKKIKKLQTSLQKFIDANIYKRYSYIDLSKANSKEMNQAVQSMSNYINIYANTVGLKTDKSYISSVVKQVFYMSNKEALSKDATDISSHLTNMIASYGMISGFSTSTFKKALLETFKNRYTNEELTKNLNDFIGKDNASMIIPIVESQIPDLTQIAKKDYALSLIKKIGGIDNRTLQNLSWVLSSEKVPVYDPNGKTFDIRITGVPILTNYVSSLIINDQYESMLISIIIVLMLLIIQTSSLLMGVVGIIPVLLTMAVNFGIMGIFGINLNAITITIASMTIGVGVDYVIQIFSRFKIEYRRCESLNETIVKTISTSGKGLIFNSLSSSAGFAMFFFSNIGGLKQFALLAISTMIISLILAVILLPSLMSYMSESYLNKKFKKEGDLK